MLSISRFVFHISPLTRSPLNTHTMNTLVPLPLVTLGVAVYNEAEFLAECLENLLKQSYPHLEILIADNGSTDGTSEICAAFAAKHPSIKHVRHPENLGQQQNFNFLPRHATGTYFCWVSGHDLLDEHFVKNSVEVLESDPGIVLAYPRTIYMTKEGRIVGEKARMPFDIRTLSSAKRFRETMWRVDCNYTYGMFRLKPMLESHLFQPFPAADRVFLAEIAVKGVFAPSGAWKYYRDNRGMRQTEIEKRHRLMRYIDPKRTYTDAELSGNSFYAPTIAGFRRIVKEGPFQGWTRLSLLWSVWLCGVIKCHLFPGADLASAIVKKLLPAHALRWVMQRIQ